MVKNLRPKLSNEQDLITTVNVLEKIATSRGLKEEEIDTIGELISNIEGAKIVIDDNRHYGIPLREALNKFMKREKIDLLKKLILLLMN